MGIAGPVTDPRGGTVQGYEDATPGCGGGGGGARPTIEGAYAAGSEDGARAWMTDWSAGADQPRR